jgi:hypothetical protein
MSRLAAVGLALVVAGAEPGGHGAAMPALNQKVVRFARGKLGQKVGNGECWTLADQALRAAGARRPGRGGMGGYVFGRALRKGETALPGDVVQFENASFTHTGPGGSSSTTTMPRHTAVVYRVRGTTLTLLHQNFGGDRTVRVGRVDLAEKKGGTVTFYRPLPAGK